MGGDGRWSEGGAPVNIKKFRGEASSGIRTKDSPNSGQRHQPTAQGTLARGARSLADRL